MTGAKALVCVLVLGQIDGALTKDKQSATAAQAYWLPPNFHGTENNIELSGSPMVSPTSNSENELAVKIARILKNNPQLLAPAGSHPAAQISGSYASSPYTSDYSINPNLYSAFLETSGKAGHGRAQRLLHANTAQHTRKLRAKKQHALDTKDIPGSVVYNTIGPLSGTDYHTFPLGNNPAAQATIQAQTPPSPGEVDSLVHAARAAAPGFGQATGVYMPVSTSPGSASFGVHGTYVAPNYFQGPLASQYLGSPVPVATV